MTAWPDFAVIKISNDKITIEPTGILNQTVRHITYL
jgi:hypothetical protein